MMPRECNATTGRPGDAPHALTPRQQEHVRQLHVDVFTKYREVEEFDDGYSFRYPSTREWLSKLEELTTYWKGRLLAWSVELIAEPQQDTIHLRISGAKGAKQFIEASMQQPPEISKRYVVRPLVRKVLRGYRMLTAPLRVKPDFVIIGAAKAGSTSLWSYLSQHPSVVPSFVKEIYYFDLWPGWARGGLWYRAFFPMALQKFHREHVRKIGFATGECTPCYLLHPDLPRSVFEVIPNAKLIATLRNPVDRAYSHYTHNVRRGLETLSFEEAIEAEEGRLRDEPEEMRVHKNFYDSKFNNFSYLCRGLYAEQLENWMSVYPEDQLLVVSAENLFTDTAATVERVVDFLGLPRAAGISERGSSVSPPSLELNRETRDQLIAYFRSPNERLYELLGTRFDWDR